MADTPEVPGRVRELAAQFGAPTPMRRGSLAERYVKCSKPGCRCAEDPAARHGPYYSLTRGVGGRTRSRWLAAEQADARAPASRGGPAVPRAGRGLLGRLRSLGRCPARRARGRPGGGPKRGLRAAFQAETVREVAALLGPGVAATLDFEALEVACRRQALALAARLPGAST